MEEQLVLLGRAIRGEQMIQRVGIEMGVLHANLLSECPATKRSNARKLQQAEIRNKEGRRSSGPRSPLAVGFETGAVVPRGRVRVRTGHRVGAVRLQAGAVRPHGREEIPEPGDQARAGLGSPESNPLQRLGCAEGGREEEDGDQGECGEEGAGGVSGHWVLSEATSARAFMAGAGGPLYEEVRGGRGLGGQLW
jgi:hypothetical protein